MSVGNGWRLDPPSALEPAAARIGLPLLFSCSEEALWAASYLLPASALPLFAPLAESNGAALSRFLLYEEWLWGLASREGGPSARIPYAMQQLALEWFWEPAVHASEREGALCLPCGKLYAPHRAPTGQPQCAACAKRSNQWPPHAVAPDVLPKWWLRCAGCGLAFRGQAQARRCDLCKLARISPSKRRGRSPSAAGAAELS